MTEKIVIEHAKSQKEHMKQKKEIRNECNNYLSIVV